jgi:hypothetical protein
MERALRLLRQGDTLGARVAQTGHHCFVEYTYVLNDVKGSRNLLVWREVKGHQESWRIGGASAGVNRALHHGRTEVVTGGQRRAGAALLGCP